MKLVNESKGYKLFGIIFSAVAGILFMVGVIWLVNVRSYIDSSVMIEGEISKIETSLDGEGDTEYTALVNYEYKGQKYKNIRLREYSGSMYEGKKLELYIDEENPSDAHVKSMVYIGPIIFFAIGAVFLIIGSIPFVMMRQIRKKRRLLMENGMKIYGKVTEGYIDNTVTVNGRHPYRLKCVYEDFKSGQPVICTSPRLWNAPDEFIERQVLIYVDRDNSGRYYVDLNSLKYDEQ